MKTLTIFSLAILAVGITIYIGVYGILHSLSFGPVFVFVGGCTAIGLTLDIRNQVKLAVKKSRVRKLWP